MALIDDGKWGAEHADIAQNVQAPAEIRLSSGLEQVKACAEGYQLRKSYGDYCGLKIIADGEFYLPKVRKAAAKEVEKIELGIVEQCAEKGDMETLVNLARDGKLSDKVRGAAWDGITPAANKIMDKLFNEGDRKALESVAARTDIPEMVAKAAREKADVLEMKERHTDFTGRKGKPVLPLPYGVAQKAKQIIH